jgi:hypothetical protein
MKKILCVMCLVSMICITGCGRNGQDGRTGQDGDVFIAYSWVYGPFYLSTNDPGISSYVLNDQYYESVPGTYNYIYQSWNGSQWSGIYTLWANAGSPGTPGEKGGIFSNGTDGEDGADGLDNYFRLACYSSGATLYRTTQSAYGSLHVENRFQERLLQEINVNGKEPLSPSERKKLKGQPLR